MEGLGCWQQELLSLLSLYSLMWPLGEAEARDPLWAVAEGTPVDVLRCFVCVRRGRREFIFYFPSEESMNWEKLGHCVQRWHLKTGRLWQFLKTEIAGLCFKLFALCHVMWIPSCDAHVLRNVNCTQECFEHIRFFWLVLEIMSEDQFLAQADVTWERNCRRVNRNQEIETVRMSSFPPRSRIGRKEGGGWVLTKTWN